MEDDRPILRAVILDFSSVNEVDVTSIQGLIDVRNQLDRHAAPELVEWHFACLNSRWTKRALAAAGFGYPTADTIGTPGRWKPIFGLAETIDCTGGSSAKSSSSSSSSSSNNTPYDVNKRCATATERDIEAADEISHDASSFSIDEKVGVHTTTKLAAVHGLNRPFFHIDVALAVHSAVTNAERKASDASTTVQADVATDVKRE